MTGTIRQQKWASDIQMNLIRSVLLIHKHNQISFKDSDEIMRVLNTLNNCESHKYFINRAKVAPIKVIQVILEHIREEKVTYSI